MDDDDTVVIVGVGCKFPGADNIDEFWRVLSKGENHVIEVPSDRWNLEAFYDEDPNEPGKTYVRRAGFITRYADWDNKLFGISEDEAARMDPQQRYVLDCVHMAMEDGGITRRDLNGTNTGVYIGVMNDDYKGAANDDLKTMTNYSLTGTASSIIAARVSYTFNLLGPAMSIDTACSSALVAIHVASQALKARDCGMVICGGVNGIMYPDIFVPLSKARMVSPTGQCQAFSDKADGYARGEGCGIVILKRKQQAIQDGNKIWAAISTGCNQDGRTTTPITAPSSVQQRKLLEDVYTKTGINPGDVQYIEAHGTGTPVGDPIETNTLGHFFADRDRTDLLQGDSILIGSVKTNIGHLESAAGAAGLVKVLLMMSHGKIVPSLHYKNPNPNINFGQYRLDVAQTLSDWPCRSEEDGGGRLSCVNSFGFGGTNSHAIIKQFPEKNDALEVHATDKRIITISGNDMMSLEQNITKLKTNIRKGKHFIQDVSFTSTCKRDHYAYRVAFQAKSKEDIISECDKQLQNINSMKPPDHSKPNLVFVFGGVGTTWPGMCQELMKKEEVFVEMVQQVDRVLTPLTKWSICQLLRDGFDVEDPMKSHLAIFTCQIALTKLWSHYGIEPDIVVGQSVGEVAAGYAAGVLPLEDAVEVIYSRSLVLAGATGGAMLVVGKCDVKFVEDVCKQFNGRVNAAVHISPKACTLSGDTDAVEAVANELTRRNREKPFLHKLNVQCAYHSHHTKTASEQLESRLQNLKGTPRTCRLISTVTGEDAKDREFSSSKYWKGNVRKPVLFRQAIVKANSTKCFNIYVELGPKPILRFHLADIVDKDNSTALPSMTEGKEYDTMQIALMELYKHGLNPCWQRITPSGNLADIPNYVFNPTKLLFQSDATSLKYDGIPTASSNHLFLERISGPGIQFKINISPSRTWFLYEHVVSGTIMVPGAFYIEVALEVGKQIFQNGYGYLRISAQFLQPLSLRKSEPCMAKVQVEPLEEQQAKSITVYRNKQKVARCQISAVENQVLKVVDLEAIRRRCTKHQTASQTYEKLKQLGFTYGPDLKILRDSMQNDRECLVEMELSHSILKDMEATHFHPAILDGLLQTPGVLDMEVLPGTTLLPGGMDCFVLQQRPERQMIAYASMVSKTKSKIRYNAVLLTTDGRVVVEVKDFFILCIGTNMNTTVDCMYQLRWEEIQLRPFRPIGGSLGSEDHTSIVISHTMSMANSINDSIEDIHAMHLSPKDKQLKHNFSCQLKNRIIHSIILTADSSTDLAQMTGEQIMQEVFDNSSALLRVCQVLATEKLDIPILIVTKQTQSLAKSRCDVKNVIGSELWGMARTLVREYPFKLTLLDVHGNVEEYCQIIRDILIVKAPYFNAESELLATGDQVYANQLDELQDHPREYTWISLLDSDNVKFKSCHPVETNRRVCEMQNTDEETHNGLVMRVETAVMHAKEMYPLTLQEAENDIPVWKEDKEDGYDLLAFEVLGKVMYFDKNDRTILRPLEGKYVACSRFTVQNLVRVREDCMLRIDNIADYEYTPGLLRTATLLWQMKHFITKGATIILAEQGDTSIELLRYMLAKPLASQLSITTVEDLKAMPTTRQLKATTLVVLTKIDCNTLDRILCKVESLQTCLSLDMFVNVHDCKMDKCPAFKILKSTDLLVGEVLDAVVPDVVHWLRKKMSKHTIQHTVKPDASTLIFTTDENRKEKVKVKKHQLIRKKCCYVVIGGLTGLGWEIVKYLAAVGAGEIVTIGRTPAKANQLYDISKLEKTMSTNITALSADISIKSSLEKAFDEIDDTIGRQKVKGIFHGGGIKIDQLFLKMTDVQLRNVLLPKVQGSWNLHVISQRYTLDFFVMHSSVTSVFGNMGQSNYGAANGFMDSLAHYRAAKGQPGLSLNWGPLSVGMAADKTVQEQLAKSGYLYLDVSDIIKELLKALMSDGHQIIVGSFNWHLIGRHLSGTSVERVRRRFRRMLGTRKEAHPIPTSADDLERHEFKSKEEITAFVIDVVAQVLAVDAARINTSTAVMDIGMNSMSAMTLAEKINDTTNCSIPVVLLLSDDTTISTLVECLQTHTAVCTETQTSDESVKPQVTYFEQQYLTQIGSTSVPLRSFMYVDIEVFGTYTDPDSWKVSVQNLHMKYPSLRTYFVPNTENMSAHTYTRAIKRPDEVTADFRILEMGTIDKTNRIPKELDMYTFDMENDLPIRVLYEKGNDSCYIRMVFSHATFDMASIMLIFEEMKTMKDEAGVPAPIASAPDIPAIVHQRLCEQEERLTKYWKSNIPSNLTPLSFASSGLYVLDEEKVATMNSKVPRQLLTRIMTYCQCNSITQFQLMLTAYQMLLHCCLGEQTVSVISLVDTRMHFPQLKREIGCLVNAVPFFLTLDERKKLQEIVNENGINVRSVMSHSLYRIDKIMEEVASKGVDPAAVFRHQLNYLESRIVPPAAASDDGSTLKIVKTVAPNHSKETVLMVWNYPTTVEMKLELEYSTLNITETLACKLLKSFIEILDSLVENPNCTVQDMTAMLTLHQTPPLDQEEEAMSKRKQSGSQNGSHIVEEEIKSGMFTKQTKNGWGHTVHLSLCQIKDSEGLRTVLRWTRSGARNTREIVINDIDSVTRTTCNGLPVVVVTNKKRSYAFKTQDKRLSDTMTECLVKSWRANHQLVTKL